MLDRGPTEQFPARTCMRHRPVSGENKAQGNLGGASLRPPGLRARACAIAHSSYSPPRRGC